MAVTYSRLVQAIAAEVTPHVEAALRESEERTLARYASQLESLLHEHEARLAELRRERDQGPRILSPKETGRRIGRSAQWVRDHREEFVVVPGVGPRPRIGITAESVDAYIACSSSRRTEGAESGNGKPSSRRRGKGRKGRESHLLPIRGEAPQ